MASQDEPLQLSKSKRKGCPVCGKIHPFWYRASKDAWYLTVSDPTVANGQRQVRIAKGLAAHKEAENEWHKRAAGLAIIKSEQASEMLGAAIRIDTICNLYLENQEDTNALAPKRFRTVRNFLIRFCKCFGADPVGSLEVGGIARIERWMATHAGWHSPSTRRMVISVIKRPFNWAVQQGTLKSNPIARMKRPRDNIRISLFNDAQVDAIIKNGSPDFVRVFKALLLTGCRPGEVLTLTADDVRYEHGKPYWFVHHKNEKHTGERRRVYLLFRELQRLTKELAAKYPTGPLFRSPSGIAWSDKTFCNAFRTATATEECRKLGLDKHKTKKRSDDVEIKQYDFIPYTARHTFCHRLMTGYYKDAKGKPIKKNSDEVANYIGDSAVMVQRVYGKLAKATMMLSEEIG